MRTAVLLLTAVAMAASSGSAKDPSFEVATIKPTAPDDRGGRYLTMQGAHQLVVKGYTLKFMVAAAYNVPPRVIAGGPSWIDSDRYDIVASTACGAPYARVRGLACARRAGARLCLAVRRAATLPSAASPASRRASGPGSARGEAECPARRAQRGLARRAPRAPARERKRAPHSERQRAPHARAIASARSKPG